ncbi:ferritin-1, chloroplastic-like [Amphibalanus amphitrite]|uniref:ferritin-1, chloroplastic-like n=1 Tax=Amphibalanus amphitrite TaxID=1232801 RepID=UPI001C903E01|nr:ferritin-1, chloroplastic-like [Amphibalanus amphitrite]XP_043200891.1 ferritin-1, chloroplastic-like [Amphibalanus amphitrite]
MRVLLLTLLVGGALACQNRLDTVVQEAIGGATDLSTSVHDDCNSDVGTFLAAHAPNYKHVLRKSLSLSLKYLAISSHFGSDLNHRLGFKKLFREASDQRFDQAIDMIKYVIKRGGNVKEHLNVKVTAAPLRPQALSSLGLALADAKDMYAEQARLHSAALCLSPSAVGCSVDADLAHQSQDAIESEVERVNELASKANQLAAMFTSTEYSLAEHLFDQHLL